MNTSKVAVDPRPLPPIDWICQRQLAELLAVSERTASIWAKAGRLRPYEHGFRNCGRRKYSRCLVETELQHRWDQAVRRQAELLDEKEHQGKAIGESAECAGHVHAAPASETRSTSGTLCRRRDHPQTAALPPVGSE